MRTLLFGSLALTTLFLGCEADPATSSSGPTGASGSGASAGAAGRGGTAGGAIGGAAGAAGSAAPGAGSGGGGTGAGGAKTQAPKSPVMPSSCDALAPAPVVSVSSDGKCASTQRYACSDGTFEVRCDCGTGACACAKSVDGVMLDYRTVGTRKTTCEAGCAGSLQKEAGDCLNGTPSTPDKPSVSWMSLTACSLDEPVTARVDWDYRGVPMALSPDGSSVYIALMPDDPYFPAYESDRYSLPAGIHRFAVDSSGGSCKLVRDKSFHEVGTPLAWDPVAEKPGPSVEYPAPVRRLYVDGSGAVVAGWQTDADNKFAGSPLSPTRRVSPAPGISCPTPIEAVGVSSTGSFYDVKPESLSPLSFGASGGCELGAARSATSDAGGLELDAPVLRNGAVGGETLYLGWKEFGSRRVLEARNVASGARLWSLEKTFVETTASGNTLELSRFKTFDSITPCGDQVCVWDSSAEVPLGSGLLTRVNQKGEVTSSVEGADVLDDPARRPMGLAFAGPSGLLLARDDAKKKTALVFYRATLK